MVASAMVLGVLFVNLLLAACGFPPTKSEALRTVVSTSAEEKVPVESVNRSPSPSPSSTNAIEKDPGDSTALTRVPKWGRYEVVLENPSWQGNPFDLEITGTFRNASSGRSVNQLGFYAGGNTWKIFFMPDELGEWNYATHSPDTDLNNKKGVFTSVPSNLPGRLIADGNRWVLQESKKYVAPIMLPTREWFKRTKTGDGVDGFIRWSKDTAGALVIGTTLVYFNQEQSEIPYIRGQEGDQFNIPMWDRLNSHYDMLRDQGMGFYIMFYSDDRESPNLHGIKAKSPEEMRLFRYAIARFSAYPIVLWDTGVDIDETRSDTWIDWFAGWFQENDPWKHPVSSRTGGGSGGKFPERATYFSNGADTLPENSTVINLWKNHAVPLAFTDRWRENYNRGNFNRERIRRAAWEVGLVGGSNLYVGGDAHDGYLAQDYAQDFEAAPDLGIRDDFFTKRIRDFKNLVPHPELLSGEQAVLSASPGREYVVYDANGGTIEIELSNTSGVFNGEWFNPRTGEVKQLGPVAAGGRRKFSSPDNKDWVLHLVNSSLGGFPCTGLAAFDNQSAPIAQGHAVNENLLAFKIFVPMISQCS